MYKPFFLIFLVLLLGLRHGLDTDHLATINSITQNTSSKLYGSKFVGFFFALGHGFVVIVVSVLIGIGISHAVPGWLDKFGSFISAFFLLVFGLINFFDLIKKTPPDAIKIQGPKTLLFSRLTRKINHPILICGVGVLFALSFDTFSQAAVFSLSASAMAGWVFAGFLGVIFTIGMMVSDGLNGWLIATLINRADKLSIIASYLVGAFITLSSIIIGGINAIKFFV